MGEEIKMASMGGLAGQDMSSGKKHSLPEWSKHLEGRMTIHEIADARGTGRRVTVTLGGLEHAGTVANWDVKADFGWPGGQVLIKDDDGYEWWAAIGEVRAA